MGGLVCGGPAEGGDQALLPHGSALDVDGLGDKLVEQLVDAGLVENVAGLYSLSEDAAAGRWNAWVRNLRTSCWPRFRAE